MKAFKFILRRINSFLCDLALTYALFYLLLFVRPTGFPIITYFFCSIILYFGMSYWLFRVSFMQKIFGIEIEKRHGNYLLFKILWIAIIPLVLSIILYYDIYLVLYVLIILISSIFLVLFTKKSLWQLCSKAQVILQQVSYKRKSLVIILLPIVFVLLLLPWFHLNFRLNDEYIQNNKITAFPISIPEKAYYNKNIKQYKEEPVNYIMQLFDKYDIVILCERIHPETTQWEFFSKIILNGTFANNVKNVFVEVGNVMEQERLDSYMNTHYFAEEDLQRAAAAIAREDAVWPLWSNTNFYDFILNLHQFNEPRDSVDRINLFFTDYLNWDEIKNPAQWDSIFRLPIRRDSLMAYHLINKYEKLATQKCLLITNTRHAWNYGKNEASYIFKKFPDKTAVVLINGTGQFLYPAMNGTLDAAALEIPDSIWAIDFRNCPLGNMLFDLMPNKKDKCTYKDLFVGMIYCKHPSEWILSANYPFILDNYQDTFLKRSALIGEKYLEQEKELIKNGYYDTIDRHNLPIFAITNLAFLAIHSIILLYLFLNLLIKLLSLVFKKNRVNTE